jgi:osmotically-inducible protein OsmY
MPDKHRRVPRSYDEIVRSTVPDPDSSRRPTARQEALAREGFRAMDEHEHVLHARVVAALEDVLAACDACMAFDVEVDRDTVTLRGSVPDVALMSRIEALVAQVEGVGEVVNRLVVGR